MQAIRLIIVSTSIIVTLTSFAFILYFIELIKHIPLF